MRVAHRGKPICGHWGWGIYLFLCNLCSPPITSVGVGRNIMRGMRPGVPIASLATDEGGGQLKHDGVRDEVPLHRGGVLSATSV